MDINEIMRVADEAYPDGLVMAHWDAASREAKLNPDAGDTLSCFIARELADVHDPDAPDALQIETAAGAIRRAARELQAVANALIESGDPEGGRAVRVEVAVTVKSRMPGKSVTARKARLAARQAIANAILDREESGFDHDWDERLDVELDSIEV